MADSEVALSHIHHSLKLPDCLVPVEVEIDIHVLREEIEA